MPNRFFACGPCWHRLPRDLQRPVLATANQLLLAPARMAAIEDAVRFYKEEAIAQEGGR